MRALLTILLLLGCAPASAGAAPKHGTPPGQERKAERQTERQTERKSERKPERQAARESDGDQDRRKGGRRVAAPEPGPAPAPAPAPPTPAGVAPAAPGPAPPTGRPAPSGARPTQADRPRAQRPERPAPARRSRAPQPPRPTAATPARPVSAAPSARRRSLAPPRPSREPGRITPAGRRPTSRSGVVSRTVTRIVEVTPSALRRALLALLGLVGALAITAAALTVAARRAERRRQAATAEADLLQATLLPVVPGHVGASSVTVAYRPAAGPAAGGDFYDVFDLPGARTAIIVGDVTGHGPQALPLTTLVRYTVRAYLEAGMAPRHALKLAGEVLDHRLAGTPVTVLAAVHDGRAGRLTYACAGHPPPVVVGDEHRTILAAASPPLGCGAPTGRRQATVAVPAGAAAVLHTDGLSDVTGGDGRLGPADLLTRLQDLGPQASASDVIAAVTGDHPDPTDDIAACVVRSDAASRLPVATSEELEIDRRDLDRGRAATFLAACGVGDAAAAGALRRAEGLVEREGLAVLEVSGDRWPAVSVRPAAAAVLSVPRG